MLMLNGQPFSAGRAHFADELPEGPEGTNKVYLKFQVEGLDAPLMGVLDTGAPWSCLDPEVAEAVRATDAAGEPKRIRTHAGVFDGKLVRLTVTLLADEGESWSVDSTVFVPTDPGWPKGRSFLGYGGLLERIRFALDPSVNDFYFGPSTSLEE